MTARFSYHLPADRDEPAPASNRSGIDSSSPPLVIGLRSPTAQPHPHRPIPLRRARRGATNRTALRAPVPRLHGLRHGAHGQGRAVPHPIPRHLDRVHVGRLRRRVVRGGCRLRLGLHPRLARTARHRLRAALRRVLPRDPLGRRSRPRMGHRLLLRVGRGHRQPLRAASVGHHQRPA